MEAAVWAGATAFATTCGRVRLQAEGTDEVLFLPVVSNVAVFPRASGDHRRQALQSLAGLGQTLATPSLFRGAASAIYRRGPPSTSVSYAAVLASTPHGAGLVYDA